MEAVDWPAICLCCVGGPTGSEHRCRAAGPRGAARVAGLGLGAPGRPGSRGGPNHAAADGCLPSVPERPRLCVHRAASFRAERFPPARRRGAVHPGGLMVDRTTLEFKSFLELYEQAPLLELGRLADEVRWKLHPENVVTYIIDRNINYTNVCVADCKFCAFYRRPKHPEGYLLSYEAIGRKIDELKSIGGVQILMQGGHNPYIPFEWYLDLLRYIKRHHPIHVHGFSPSEVDFFAGRFGMTIEEVIKALMAAGLDSIPGGGGEILVQSIRDQVARKKAGADRWLEVMEIAHGLGLKTSVTMMYGLGESNADRIEHLYRVREVQRKTRGFTAFICWPLQPENTGMADT